VTSGDDTAARRHQVDELLRQIDDQRRRRLLLEASGVYAPGLEREADATRQQLAELVQ
jgi:hypothetical protein